MAGAGANLSLAPRSQNIAGAKDVDCNSMYFDAGSIVASDLHKLIVYLPYNIERENSAFFSEFKKLHTQKTAKFCGLMEAEKSTYELFSN